MAPRTWMRAEGLAGHSRGQDLGQINNPADMASRASCLSQERGNYMQAQDGDITSDNICYVAYMTICAGTTSAENHLYMSYNASKRQNAGKLALHLSGGQLGPKALGQRSCPRPSNRSVALYTVNACHSVQLSDTSTNRCARSTWTPHRRIVILSPHSTNSNDSG